MSAQDSQGGPSPTRARSPWAQPVHAPSPAPSVPPSPCSARPECPQRESHRCSLYRLQRHLPQTPAQDPPVVCLPSASPPLPAPLRPPVPRTSSGTWGSAADPHIPTVLQTRGRSRGEGVRARDRLLISGVSRGTKGSGRPDAGAALPVCRSLSPPAAPQTQREARS